MVGIRAELVRAILQGGKTGFALDPLQHHPTSDFDLNRLGLQGVAGMGGKAGVDLGDLMRRPHVIGKCVALFAKRAQFGAAFCQYMGLAGDRQLVFVRHQFILRRAVSPGDTVKFRQSTNGTIDE